MAPDAPIRARYSNFDIRIEERETSYRAIVVDSPAGEASSDFNLPFSEDRLENLVLKISNSIGAARRQTRRIGSAQRRQVEEFGSALFDAVFTGEVKEVFDRSRERTGVRGAGLRIRLRLGDAPALINIPWEYLYDRARNEFLALSPTTPLYRYAELQRTAAPLRVTPPLRLLVMVSQPTDVSELSGGIEWERLQDELGGLTRKGLVEPALVEPATKAGLEAALKEKPCHILHFVGHGGFDEDSDDGGLVFEGKDRRSVLVTGRDLGIALGPFHSVRLVVLNACEGARGSLKDPFGGAAQALVRQGIPAVVAMQFEVTDDAAVTFAQAFYERIALQDPIDAALGWARRAIFADENEVEWATPVLYLRSPTGRIFARVAEETPPAEPLDELLTTGEQQPKKTAEKPGRVTDTRLLHEPKPAERNESKRQVPKKERKRQVPRKRPQRRRLEETKREIPKKDPKRYAETSNVPLEGRSSPTDMHLGGFDYGAPSDTKNAFELRPGENVEHIYRCEGPERTGSWQALNPGLLGLTEQSLLFLREPMEDRPDVRVLRIDYSSIRSVRVRKSASLFLRPGEGAFTLSLRVVEVASRKEPEVRFIGLHSDWVQEIEAYIGSHRPLGQEEPL